MQVYNYFNKEQIDFFNLINSCINGVSDFKDLYENLNNLLVEEFDIYFYSVLLLDAGDNNFYIEHTSAPALYDFRYHLYSMFENKLIRKIYGFGEFRASSDDIQYLNLGNEIIEVFDAYPIFIKIDRMIGFVLIHDRPVNDYIKKEKLRFVMTQLGNTILNLKRYSLINDKNKSYVDSLKVLQFLNHLLNEQSRESVMYYALNDMFDKTNSEAGCIAAYDGTGWKTTVELGMNDAVLDYMKYKDGSNILDFVAQIQQIYNIDETQIKEQLDLSELKANLKNLLFIPLQVNGECEFMAVLANYDVKALEEMMVYIMKVSDITATGLHNSDIMNDNVSSFQEKEMKYENLRLKFIQTLKTMFDEIKL